MSDVLCVQVSGAATCSLSASAGPAVPVAAQRIPARTPKPHRSAWPRSECRWENFAPEVDAEVVEEYGELSPSSFALRSAPKSTMTSGRKAWQVETRRPPREAEMIRRRAVSLG